MIVFSSRVLLGGAFVPAALSLEGGLIVGVEPIDAAPAGALDFGDHLVTPALVNAHTHLPMAAFRGLSDAAAMAGNVVEDLFFRLEQHLTAEDVRAFTRVGAYESLLAGVGTVWEHYYHGAALAAGLRDVGLGGVVAPTLQDLDGPGRDACEAQLEATLALDADAALAAAGVVAALGPHATDTVSDDLWRRVARLAADRALPVHAHVAQSIEEVERSFARHGRSPVARLAHVDVLDAAPAMLLVHALFCGDADRALLDPARHVLGFCPSSQMQYAFPADVTAWRAAGLRVALGTDCAASNDGMSVQGELKLLAGAVAWSTTFGPAAARLARGGSLDDARRVQAHRARRHADAWTPAALLDAVWAAPGGLHPRHRVGILEAGARADLAVWDADHPALWPAADPLRALALAHAPPALHAMVLGGRVVGTPGDLAGSVRRSEAYAAALDEARGRRHHLLRRAGLARLADRPGDRS